MASALSPAASLRQGSTLSDIASTVRSSLLSGASSLRAGMDRAASLPFPFHGPVDMGCVSDEHVRAVAFQLPDTARSGSLQEPLLDGAPSGSLEDADKCSRWVQLKRLLGLAIPLFIQTIGNMLMVIISTTFVGHLNDPTTLSAVILASSLYNVLGSSMIIGLVSGMETLAGQAFGAGNFPLIGIIYQRAQLSCSALILPVATLFWFAKPLLIALGQHPEIVAITEQYLRLLIPSLFLTMVNETTRKYLLAQRVVAPAMFSAVTSLLCCPLYNWLYIHKLGMGARGAALAVVSCNGTNSLILTGYRLYRDGFVLRGTRQQTWFGYSSEAYKGWGTFLSFGIPAALMICLEWWVWELMIFMAGLTPTAEISVGVMGLAMQISSAIYMFPISMGSATSTRVANSLGAGLAKTAQSITWLAICFQMGLWTLVSTTVFLLRHELVGVFTGDPTVIQAAAALMPALALCVMADGVGAVAAGVLRACGKQTLGVGINLAGYWLIGLPAAYYLGFRVGLGVLGFWIALAGSGWLQGLVFLVCVARFDWQHEVERSRHLTAKHAASMGHLPALDEAEEEEQRLLDP